MTKFISAKEAAEKWKISQRRVSILCSENRISGAMTVGNMWIIPSEAEKPLDKRMRNTYLEKRELKPFVKWVGGKSQIIGELEKLINFDKETALLKYAEPFVGGGAFLFKLLSKYNFKEIYISDVNSELINAYKTIKTQVNDLIIELSFMQKTFHQLNEDDRKNYYYSIREDFNKIRLNNDANIKKAAYFIFLNKTCFNGLYRVNKKGHFNVPIGSYKNPTICDEENLKNVSIALQNVMIYCEDFSKASYFIDSTTLVYFDPPYRPISKTASFTAYSTDCFDDNEQIRLSKFIDEINNRGAKIILSNSDPQNINPNDDFFKELYNKYNIRKIDATRMVNSDSEKRGKIKELLISNY